MLLYVPSPVLVLQPTSRLHPNLTPSPLLRYAPTLFRTSFLPTTPTLTPLIVWHSNKPAIPNNLLRMASAPAAPVPTSVQVGAKEELLWATGISKSYDGERVQFQNISVTIARSKKVGIVGENGTGKSTLLRVLSGHEDPDEGTVQYKKGIVMAVVDQESDFPQGMTIFEAAFSSSSPIVEAIRDYEKIAQRMAVDASDPLLLAQLQKVSERMDALGAWEADAFAIQVLTKLGLAPQGHILDQKVGEISGGQKKRLALAAALIQKPDIILLDEPTNHLDVDAIEWLEEVLSRDPRLTALIVTHDRYFLDKVCNEVIELNRSVIYNHIGGYQKLLENKAAREEQDLADAHIMKQRLKKELEWMRKQPKARGTKSKARIEQFYHLEAAFNKKVDATRASGVQELATSAKRLGNDILMMNDVNLSFGPKIILKDFNYVFRRGCKIGIVGSNGVGKSSFLNAIMGKIPINSGEMKYGETVEFGHYEQGGLELPEDLRVSEYLTRFVSVDESRQLLKKFGFGGSQGYSYISKLSGGERRRIQLLTILLKNPNFLILDEVTNDLDLQTIGLLEEFLMTYQGCVLLVSHDRFFMDRIADELLVFEGNGVVEGFNGKFTEYYDWLKEQENVEKSERVSTAVKEKEEKKITESKQKKKLSYKEKQDYENLEAEIEKLNQRNEEITRLLNSSQVSSDYEKLMELTNEQSKLLDAIETKTERWLELAEIVEGL